MELHRGQSDEVLPYTEAHVSPSTTPSSGKAAKKASRAKPTRLPSLGSQTPSSNTGDVN
jgi:hypothetical protein